MGKLVSLKGNKYGITVYVAPSASYEEAKTEAVELVSSTRMFADQKIAVGYEGRIFTDFEKEDFTKAICQAGKFECVCILDFSIGTEERFKAAVERSMAEEESLKQQVIEESSELKKYREDVDKLLSEIAVLREKNQEKDSTIADLTGQLEQTNNVNLSNIARFYKGNLRSGFVMNEESSLVIVGDVNAGSEVISNGNIIILGTLRGSARAGANGNRDAFVFALNMQPMQVAIDDVIARAGDNSSKKESHEPSIATIKDDNIAIELATKTVLNEINI